MRSANLLLALLVASLLALPSCGSAPEQAAPESSATETAAESANPLDGIDASSRVVALSRSVGEMWLLAGGRLAGVTDDALDLPDLSEDVVSVGSLDDPSAEQVLALNPDLVMLAEDLPTYQELSTALAEAGVPVLSVRVDSFDDYDHVMADLTRATGRDDLYQNNVEQVRSQIDQVLSNSTSGGSGTYLALRISPDASRMVGDGDFACAMLDDLGMNDVGSDQGEASPETIAAADPSWVFVVFEDDAVAAQRVFEEEFASQESWSDIVAVREGHVVMLPRQLFQSRPNARWGEAYAYLSQVLHGAWA